MEDTKWSQIKMSRKCKDQDSINIAVLQEKVNEMNKFIDDIHKNHLPHIYSRLNKIDTRMAYYAGGLAVLMVLLQFIVPMLI